MKKITLKTLLEEGYQVSVINGRLDITPTIEKLNKKSVRDKIMKEIAHSLDIDIYGYKYFTTGIYHNNRSPGINLSYENFRVNNSEHYMMFNAELNRARTTFTSNAGSPYKGKQFRVTENMSFVKFWKLLEIELPESLSRFHQVMGKLKSVHITGQCNHKGKLINRTVEAVNVAYEKLLNSHNLHTKITLKSHNQRITETHKGSIQNHEVKRLNENLSACEDKYGLLIQGKADRASADEWLQSYDPDNKLDDLDF